MEPRAIMGSGWNFLLWRVPSTHVIQNTFLDVLLMIKSSTSFFKDNFRRFRLSRWPYFRSQLHWLVHDQPDSSNCTTLPLRSSRHVWVQNFTPSLTGLCHLSTFAAFHTLNGFYDRHLLNSWILLLLALLPIDVNSNTTVALPLRIPALPNMTSAPVSASDYKTHQTDNPDSRLLQSGFQEISPTHSPSELLLSLRLSSLFTFNC